MARDRVELEDIQGLRRRLGIDDVELGAAIRRLRVDDVVGLTFLPAGKASAGETLPVRITSIRGRAFRGKLTRAPAAAALATLRAGALVAFTAAHIHSVLKRWPTRTRGPEPGVLLKD
jgi:hypothetical protein